MYSRSISPGLIYASFHYSSLKKAIIMPVLQTSGTTRHIFGYYFSISKTWFGFNSSQIRVTNSFPLDWVSTNFPLFGREIIIQNIAIWMLKRSVSTRLTQWCMKKGRSIEVSKLWPSRMNWKGPHHVLHYIKK